jgi:tetratricopeptide (TPR) repeat protein
MKSTGMILAITAVLLIPVRATCGDGVGGTESPFSLGSGVRNISMGNAASAVWGGSYSLLLNPAGLESIEKAEIGFFHTSLFEDGASYYSILGSYPFLDMGTISAGVVQLTVDGIETRNAENMLISSDLSNRQTRYLVGYSRKLYGSLTGGLNLKLDRLSQGEYSANGFGADIGIGYERTFDSSFIDGMTAGIVLINLIEPTMKIVEEESADPRGLRAGAALWAPVIGSIDDRLMLALDIEDKRYGDARLHAGIEYNIEPYISFRGGYDDGFPTFGLGFKFSTITLDYGYRTSDLENYHLFSLTVGFGATRSKRLEDRMAVRELEIRSEIDRQIRSYEDRFIESSNAEAENALKAGHFKESVALYDKVLMMDSGNEKALKGRKDAEIGAGMAAADKLFEMGDYTGALLAYRALSDKYGDADLDTKIAACDEMISSADDRRAMVGALFERGLEYYSERKWSEAGSAFRKVVELDPGHELAKSYLEKSGNRTEGERKKILLRIDELLSSRRFPEARELIQTGKERYGLDSDFDTRQARLVQMQAEAERENRKQEAKAQDSRTEPTREELERLRPAYERGAKHFRSGKFDMAVSEWETIWERHPGYENLDQYLVKAYQYWGMELYTKHKYDEALEIWQRILKVDNNNEKAIRYIRKTREELDRLRSLTG